MSQLPSTGTELDPYEHFDRLASLAPKLEELAVEFEASRKPLRGAFDVLLSTPISHREKWQASFLVAAGIVRNTGLTEVTAEIRNSGKHPHDTPAEWRARWVLCTLFELAVRGDSTGFIKYADRLYGDADAMLELQHQIYLIWESLGNRLYLNVVPNFAIKLKLLADSIDRPVRALLNPPLLDGGASKALLSRLAVEAVWRLVDWIEVHRLNGFVPMSETRIPDGSGSGASPDPTSFTTAQLSTPGRPAALSPPPPESAPVESSDEASELSFELLNGSVKVAGIGGSTGTAPMVDGFYYIARLLRTPGKEVLISELVSCKPTPVRGNGLSDYARAQTRSLSASVLAEADALETTDYGNDPVADADAVVNARDREKKLEADVTRYRQEIAEAERNGEEADANDSRHQLQKAQEELDRIRAFLRQAVGLGGKPRSMRKPKGLSASNIHGRLGDAYARLRNWGLAEYAGHFQASIGQEGQAFIYEPSPPLGEWRVIGVYPAGER